MEFDDTALAIVEADYAILPLDEVASPYDTFLAELDEAAQAFDGADVFSEYLAKRTAFTRANQLTHLNNFCRFLEEARQAKEQALCAQGVALAPDLRKTRDGHSLQTDPLAWRGMTYRVLRSYIHWQLHKGYPHDSINNRVSTIHVYCKLASPPPDGAGVLDEQTYRLICTVKGYRGGDAINVDEQRKAQGIATKIGAKGPPIEISKREARKLKESALKLTSKRPHDAALQERDVLMMCLFIEHAFRVGEVARLQIEGFNLARETVAVYRSKGKVWETHKLQELTLIAAETYLTKLRELSVTSGPLFPGYTGQQIKTHSLRKRVGQIGELAGIEHLTPHALRHFWAYYVLDKKMPLDKAMRAGGWKTLVMLLRYAKRLSLANDGIIIQDDEDND